MMKLSRVSYTEQGTFGVLSMLDGIDYYPRWLTLENPWRDNKPRISCIPAGHYGCQRIDSPRFGNTFEIMDIDGRTHVVFHWGNTHIDTLGCVLLATKYGALGGVPAILTSKPAFKGFLDATIDIDAFTLDIVDVDGVPF